MEIQPILDRHCVRCHHDKGDDGVPPVLTGDTVHLVKMKRRFSRSYLELTHTSGTNGDWNHSLVNWIDCMSEPTMLPPYYRGAATSQLLTLLEQGHEQVTLSAEELDKIACWIDLLVPFCGDYREANTWSPSERDFYDRTAARRRAVEEQERVNLRDLIEKSAANERTINKSSDRLWRESSRTANGR